MRIDWIRTIARMASTVAKVPEVDIDPSGVFKYILIKLTGSSENDTKMLVRGFAECNYHGI